MPQVITRIHTLAALALVLLSLAGCPLGGQPALSVTPGALSIGSGQDEEQLLIQNTGGGTLTWTLTEVTRSSPDDPWIDGDIPWLSTDKTTGTATTTASRVTLAVDRAGLSPGTINNTGVRISSNGGTRIVPVALSIEQTLSASPTRFNLSENDTFANFTLINSGSSAAEWEVLFLPNPDDTNTAEPLPAGFNVTPPSGILAAGASIVVRVEWPQGQSDFYLLVESTSGIIPLSFLFGAALEGLEVTPETLTLFVDSEAVGSPGPPTAQPPSTLRIRNVSNAPITWSIELVDRVSTEGLRPISISPITATTSPGTQTEVDVAVTRPADIVTGSGNYDLLITAGDGFQLVPIIVEILPLPEITLSDAPNPEEVLPGPNPISILDFGEDEIQKEFWIVNTGPRASQLFFRISHSDQEAENPVIVSVDPLQGNTNGDDRDFYLTEFRDFVDGVPVTVTIDRSNMEEDTVFREITVTAFQAGFETALEVVEEKTLQIRIQRPPLVIEGQLNRSRPPYIMRFVFLLRDTLGQVIPTQTQADRDDIEFVIYENEELLELDETSQFVSGPEDLKVNLVLLLDFTGSMYLAGTDDEDNPLAPGEALEQVLNAAKLFLDDLPPSYRVALLYHSERQQPERVIHQFSTDRESLKQALDNFTLPPADFGTSTIRDALMDSMELLAAEDSQQPLPFDEADVRAVLFITDGNDNSSIATASEVVDFADDTRTRLYPLAYAPAEQPADLADLVVFAEDTGGHLYNARDVRRLSRLLGSESSLALAQVPDLDAFEIQNIGTTTLAWSVTKDPAATWLQVGSVPSGQLEVNSAITIPLQGSPALVPVGTTRSTVLTINSSSGEATVRVRATGVFQNGNAQVQLDLELNDEPGTVWRELQNQIVLTYITPAQEGGEYRVIAQYQETPDRVIQGQFQEDAEFFPGDVRAGQLALLSSGIIVDDEPATPEQAVRTDVFLRADYVPRNVNRFRLRFFLEAPDDAPVGAAAALEQARIQVQIAENGLLQSEEDVVDAWRLIPEEDGIYLLLTEEDNPLRYGSFGNLLRIQIDTLAPYVNLFAGQFEQPTIYLSMRVDNQIYVLPATPTSPSTSKFFLYPGGPTNPDRPLLLTTASDLAPPARTAVELAFPNITPEAPNAWDLDIDGIPDFNDPAIANEDQPGPLVIPSPLQIPGDSNVVIFTLRNNRLDTFDWNLDGTSLPEWIAEPGNTQPLPSGSLAPGESTAIELIIDRSGLPSGFVSETIVINTDAFADLEVPVILAVP
jgi:hypothetical protein